MFSDQIEQLLSDVPGFAGVYPSNHIPVVKRRPAAYVINTAPVPDRYGGDHWVAIILKHSGKGEYFDSFGLPPIEHDIVDFLKTTCYSSITYSNQMIQSPASSACGLYCVDYIRSRLLNHQSKSQFLSMYKTDFKANDQLVADRLSCLLFAQQL